MATKTTKSKKSVPVEEPQVETKSTKSTKNVSVSKEIDLSKLKQDTRLISIAEWDWDRVIIGPPVKQDAPDGTAFRRGYIKYLYDEHTYGPAIVELGKHWCYGVQPNNVDPVKNTPIVDKNGVEKPLTDYRVPICLTNTSKDDKKSEPTPEEQREIEFFEEWTNKLTQYALDNKAKMGKGNKSDDQITALISPTYYHVNTEGVEVPPKFYTSLIYYSKDKKVGTVFYGPGDKRINPITMTKGFNIYATIRFDNIYIGQKISLKHKVYDATVEPTAVAPTKRLARPNTMPADAEVSSGENDHSGGNDDTQLLESDHDE
jgi:hypothetical protein